MKFRSPKKLFKSRKLKILTVLALIMVFGATAWAITANSNQAGSDDQDSTDVREEAASGPQPNLEPPTSEQKKATDDFKSSLAQPPESTATTSSGKRLVYPVITNASHSEVNALVEGVTEDGGTCMATATKGSQTVTGSSSGFADVNKTSCAPITISLSPGTWSVTVKYNSNTSEGESEPFKVN